MKRTLLLCALLGSTPVLSQPLNEYLLKVSPVAERLTVWIGNTPPLDYRKLDRIRLQDISSRLKVGTNSVRMRWQGLERLGDLSIRAGSGDVLFSYPFDDTRVPLSGEVVFTVMVPARGTTPTPVLMASRKVEGGLLQEGRLSVNLSGGVLSLTLNGQNIGDYLGSTNRRLENLKSGQNTLKIRWSKDFGVSLPQGALELKDDQGKRLLFWNTDPVRSLQGEVTLGFRVP